MTKIQKQFMHSVICNFTLQTKLLEILLEKEGLIDPVICEQLQKQKLGNEILFKEIIQN